MRTRENGAYWPVNIFTLVGVAVFIGGYISVARSVGLSVLVFREKPANIVTLVVDVVAVWTGIWIVFTLIRAVTGQLHIPKKMLFAIAAPPLIAGVLASGTVVIRNPGVAQFEWTVQDPLWWIVYPFGILLPLAAGGVSAGWLLLLNWLVGRLSLTEGVGRCAHCAYDLRGNVSGICPECGRPIAYERRKKRTKKRPAITSQDRS